MSESTVWSPASTCTAFFLNVPRAKLGPAGPGSPFGPVAPPGPAGPVGPLTAHVRRLNLVVQAVDESTMMTFGSVCWAMTVLVAYDHTANADVALAAAAAAAQGEDGHLTIVTIARLERRPLGCDIGTTTWNRFVREDARAALVQALGRVPRALDVDFQVLEGEPVKVLAAAARARGCRLVVLPGRRSRVARAFGRDLARRLRRAGVPRVLEAHAS